MTNELWVSFDGEHSNISSEPFEGAYRFVKTGERYSRAKEDERLVGAFHAGGQAQFLSDNPHDEGSERWEAWRAGFNFATREAA